jgi:hypothetical protein
MFNANVSQNQYGIVKDNSYQMEPTPMQKWFAFQQGFIAYKIWSYTK